MIGRGANWAARPPPTAPKAHIKKKLRRAPPDSWVRDEDHRQDDHAQAPHERNDNSKREPSKDGGDGVGSYNHPTPPLEIWKAEIGAEYPYRHTPSPQGPRLGHRLITLTPTPVSVEGMKIRGISSISTSQALGGEDVESAHSLPFSIRGPLQSICGELKTIESLVINPPQRNPTAHPIRSIKGQLSLLTLACQKLYENAKLSSDQSVELSAEEKWLQERIEDVEGDLTGVVDTKDWLNGELKSARGESKMLTLEKKTLNSDVENLRAALTRSAINRKEFTDQVVGLKSDMSKLKQENDKLKRENENLKQENHKLKQQVERLEGRDANMLTEANRSRLNCLERGDEIKSLRHEVEVLKYGNSKLENDHRELQTEAENLHAEKDRLETIIQQRDAEIHALKIPALPGPLLQELVSAQDTLPYEAQYSPTSSSSDPYIKEEESGELVVAQTMANTTTHDMAQKLYQLGSGLSSVLGKVFHINAPNRCNDAVVKFMTHLGAMPETACINITHATGFWEVRGPWTTAVVPSLTLRRTLEERFVQLCLLIPFLQDKEQAKPFRAISDIVTSLIKADHSQAPRAGPAFLETMASLKPTVNAGSFNAKRVALAVMVCELCRLLEQTFPDVPRRPWSIGHILGQEVELAVERFPVAKLSAAMNYSDRSSTQPMREHLAATCGDQFCVISANPGDGEGMRDFGLLHCGENHNFLMIDFAQRYFRIVDCQLASMRSNVNEPRKLDLIIARPEGVLFEIPVAPKDVAAFWVKYAMGEF